MPYRCSKRFNGALNNKGENLKIHIPKNKNLNFSKTFNSINVDVKDSTLCPRYSGLTISNITVGESPNWLKVITSNWCITYK